MINDVEQTVYFEGAKPTEDKCLMVFNNGNVYIGPLEKGNRVKLSTGKMIYTNGDVYVGQWVQNQR